MGASRKLQGEIDRVLKKVQEGVEVFDGIWNKVYDTENANQKEKFEADLKKEIKKLQRYRDQIKTWIQSSDIKDKKVSPSYEQALMDARKLIEREMERFKVCEKETKTKAFSKEGLGQQPKTDPREKAKSETRDWLNNVVGDLESQIDNFEAEIEGLSVKKGKMRPPRLTHLEASIARHKAHIMKLELILRLLDNDELSPDQVNDVKDFLEDYVERNQEDFDEFNDVDELYSTLPLEKVEALEDLVSLGPSSLAKGVGSVTTASPLLGMKNSVASSPTQLSIAMLSSESLSASQDQGEDTVVQESNTDVAPKSPPSKGSATGSLTPAIPPGISSGLPVVSISAAATSIPVRPSVAGTTVASILSGPPSSRGIAENTSAVSASLLNSSISVKEEDTMAFPARRPSPAIPEIGAGNGFSRGISNQPSISSNTIFTSASGISGNVALGSVPAFSDLSKQNTLNVDERTGSSGLPQALVSPLSSRILLQSLPNANDGANSNDSNIVGEPTISVGRVFSPAVVSGVQWRHQSSAFQNVNENVQFRGRPEIAPDQREKFLQRLQQVQQQSHSNLLNVSHLSAASPKPFTAQQQNSLLQQYSPQSASVSPHVGLGLGVQGLGLGSVGSASQQPTILQQSSQHPLVSTGTKDGDAGHANADEQQQNMPEDLVVDPTSSPNLSKMIGDNDLKTPYVGGLQATGTISITEGNQLSRDSDMSPGQPLQPGQSSASLGVIGRKGAVDLGAIGDNINILVGNSGEMHDRLYNLQMLKAAFYKLPDPRDSERAKNYVPKHPALTPASFPQIQAPIVDNPAFWERLGLDPLGTDNLFFSFYYQQNTPHQYLAARELKRQSWRFHRKFNTWFQRHEEPKVTNDNFERGNYVYFDFHMANDGSQQGWCQRIKTDFTFEYDFLEDELVV